MEKIALERIRLDAGGYTRGGRYFGTGEPLWSYEVDLGGRVVHGYIRATSRGKAREAVAEILSGKGY